MVIDGNESTVTEWGPLASGRELFQAEPDRGWRWGVLGVEILLKTRLEAIRKHTIFLRPLCYWGQGPQTCLSLTSQGLRLDTQ